jgi:hypothetical protein
MGAIFASKFVFLESFGILFAGFGEEVRDKFAIILINLRGINVCKDIAALIDALF